MDTAAKPEHFLFSGLCHSMDGRRLSTNVDKAEKLIGIHRESLCAGSVGKNNPAE